MCSDMCVCVVVVVWGLLVRRELVCVCCQCGVVVVVFQVPGERLSRTRRYKVEGSVRKLVGADISC